MRAFPLFYCILFCPIWLSSLGGLLFSVEKMEVGKVDLRGKKGGGKLEGVEGGESVAGMYCIREESIFNKKKEKRSKR